MISQADRAYCGCGCPLIETASGRLDCTNRADCGMVPTWLEATLGASLTVDYAGRVWLAEED